MLFNSKIRLWFFLGILKLLSRFLAIGLDVKMSQNVAMRKNYTRVSFIALIYENKILIIINILF